MNRIPSKYKKLVLVCTNFRPAGEKKCCANGGAEAFRDALKARVAELQLPVRVSKSGCLGNCETGPTVVIMPDDIWLGGVTVEDVEPVIELLRAA